MKNIPENTGQKQAGQFQKGVSGNPAGKPKGARHKATLAAMALLEGESEALTRKAVELALEGDTTALRLCLERIAPALKSTAPMIMLDAPLPHSLTDRAKTLIDCATRGEIPPDIAAQLVTALTGTARIEEMESLKDRLEALERALKGASI